MWIIRVEQKSLEQEDGTIDPIIQGTLVAGTVLGGVGTVAGAALSPTFSTEEGKRNRPGPTGRSVPESAWPRNSPAPRNIWPDLAWLKRSSLP